MSLDASVSPLELEHPCCALCGGTQSEPWLATSDRNWPIHTNTFDDRQRPARVWTLVRCVACGLIYLNPRPVGTALSRFYPTDYYAYRSLPPPAPSFRQNFKRWLRRHRSLWGVLQYTPWADGCRDPITEVLGWRQPGTILDVGCGAGDFLNRLAPLGWTTVGVDVSEAAVLAARARGHEAHVGDLADGTLPAESMDVVWLSHVLEHTADPRRTLVAARRVLRSSGRAVIYVPNAGSLWARTLGEYSAALDLPRHLYHFTTPTLRRLLTESGFRVIALRRFNTPRYFAHSLALAALAAQTMADTQTGLTPRDLLDNHELHTALLPFCRACDALGEGVQLEAVVAKAD